jgi:uncharacterized protein (TIGR02145 family)
MKKNLFLALITGVTLSSCSKKSDETKTPSNTVSINGTDYATVKIGTQTWTTVNYNGAGGANYNDGSTNNPTYGKLYTLAEAKAVTLPTGWRLPTKADAEKLLVYLGATGTTDIGADGDATVSIKLKSKSDWTFTQGNNSSGFNAYPAGDEHSGTYEALNQSAEFWTSTLDAYNDQLTLHISNVQDGVNVNDDASMDYIPSSLVSAFRLNIRFVKNN